MTSNKTYLFACMSLLNIFIFQTKEAFSIPITNTNKEELIQQKNYGIKKELIKTYQKIESPEEKEVIKKILFDLKYLKETNKKIDQKDFKQHLLVIIKNLTSISSIKCITLIISLYQIKGIISSELLLEMIKEICNTIRKTVYVTTASESFKILFNWLPVSWFAISN